MHLYLLHLYFTLNVGSVTYAAENGSEVRTYVLWAVSPTGTNNSRPTPANLSLPGLSFNRCEFHRPRQYPTRSNGEGGAGVVGQKQGHSLYFNWTIPSFPGQGCMDFIAYIIESSGMWFSASNKICERKGCFRSVTSLSGVLTSGGVARYENNVDCVTLLRVSPLHLLHVQFERLDLEPFRDDYNHCFDYVSLGGSEMEASSSANQICGKYTGNQLRNMSFVSDGNYVVLKFVSDGKISRTGFSAIFYSAPTSGCDAFLNESSGHIEPPSGAGQYFPNIHCTYSIQVPRNYRITLTFREFQLQEKDEYNTCLDYVAVETAVGGRPEMLCGSGRHTVTSSLNWLRLVFHSDFLVQAAGFKAVYTAFKSCENATYFGENGTLTSMGYPGSYLNNQHCYLTITTMEDDKVIELQFDLLQTQANATSYLADDDCHADYVEIYVDGRTDARADRRCGDWRPKLELLRFRSTGRHLVVRFVSDAAGTGLGFSARWLAVVNKTSERECDEGWAPYGTSCYKVWKAPKAWSEAEEACEGEGGQLVAVKFAKVGAFLQRLVEQSLNSTSEAVLWIGANDQQYEADFYWADGSRVSYTDWFPGWTEFNFYNRQPSDDGLGSQDCVELRASFSYPSKGTGHTPTLFWNDRHCATPNSFICERVKLEDLVPWPLAPYVCSVTLEVNELRPTGSYTSPGFPSYYDDHTNCSATVRAPRGYVIQVEFFYFNLEDAQSCEYDSLTMSSGLDNATISTTTRCGDWNNRLKLLRYVSLSDTLHLRFVADHSRHFRGFKARYSLINRSVLCPGPHWRLLSDRCYLLQTSSPYQDWMHAHNNCLMFSAHLAFGTDSSQHHAIKRLVTDDTGGSSYWLGARWSNVTSSWARPDGSSIDADLVDTLTSGRWGRRMSERVSEVVCLSVSGAGNTTRFYLSDCSGGRPHICQRAVMGPRSFLELSVDDNTTLTSPGFQTAALYPTNVHIRWTVQVDAGLLILFDIPTLDIEYHPECLYDFLLITDPDTGSLTRLCGTRKGLSHSVSSYRATVDFVSDYRTTGLGFSMTWITLPADSGENMTLILTEDGNGTTGEVLESLNYPRSYLNDLSYWVTITVSERFRVWVELLALGLNDGDQCGDSLSVYTDVEHAEKHRLCGAPPEEQLLNYKYLSRGNYMGLHLYTDRADNGPGYKIAYRRVPRAQFNYSETRIVGHKTSGKLLSINTPYLYPPRLLSTTILQAPLGTTILLTPTHLNLTSNSSNCLHNDHLDVIDPYAPEGGEVVLERMCNRKSGSATFTSHLHVLVVRFVADGWEGVYAGGYSLEYTVLPDPMFVNKSLTSRKVPLGSCSPSPCEHGGQCQMEDGQAGCACVGPYTGLVCLWKHCDRKPCKNSGKCVNIEGGYNCSCPVGYGGATCEVELELCRVSRCNRHGVCAFGPTWRVSCACEDNYSGSACELLKSFQFKGSRLMEEPFWIGVVIMISMLTLIGFIVILRRKCLKHVEIDCSCVEHEQLDTGKDKVSFTNDNGSTYTYNGYGDYMSESVQHTPRQSTEPSRCSSPVCHQSEVPTIKVYQEDDVFKEPTSVFTTKVKNSHSLNATGAVFVPYTAEIISATSMLSSYHNQALSAIDEEPTVSVEQYIAQEVMAGGISENEEENESSMGESREVAFIHRDAEGRTVGTSGETTIKHSLNSKARLGQTSDSEESPSDIYLNFRHHSLDETQLKDSDIHGWCTIGSEKSQVDQKGMVYGPERHNSHLIESFKMSVDDQKHQSQDEEANWSHHHRRADSTQRQEQFISSVHRARNQNSFDYESPILGQCHSSFTGCTVTPFDPDTRFANLHRKSRKESDELSQSLEISDSDMSCSRSKYYSDEVPGFVGHFHRSHRSFHHNARNQHQPRKRSKTSEGQMGQHNSESDQIGHNSQFMRTESWAISVDIPVDDVDSQKMALSRCPSYRSSKSTKSNQTGSQRRSHRTSKDTRQRDREDREMSRHQYTSSSRRHRHHKRSTESLNSLNDCHHSVKPHHCYHQHRLYHHHIHHSREYSESNHLSNYKLKHGYRHNHDISSHHEHEHPHHLGNELRPAMHQQISVTLSDPESHRNTLNQQGAGCLKPRQTRSTGDLHRFVVECSHWDVRENEEVPTLELDSENKGSHTSGNMMGTFLNYSQGFDSANSISLVDSIDYLKVPSLGCTTINDPESSVQATSSESNTITSQVSSNNPMQQSGNDDNEQPSNQSWLPVQSVGLSSSCPSGHELLLDTDSTTIRQQNGATVMHFLSDHQNTLNRYPDELYIDFSLPCIRSPGVECASDVVRYDRYAAQFDERSDIKHPLHDSAYQSKETSTEKNNSKPGSNVVSPTLANYNGAEEAQYHTISKFPSAGKEDQRVRNQLELAARKLAAIKHATDCSMAEAVNNNCTAIYEDTAIPSVTVEHTIGCSQRDAKKFAKKFAKSRKMWPSRILSIIMDEDESDLSDLGADSHKYLNTGQSSNERHYFDCSNPKLAKETTEDYQGGVILSSGRHQNACVSSISQAKSADIIKQLIQATSESSEGPSSPGSPSLTNTPDTVSNVGTCDAFNSPLNCGAASDEIAAATPTDRSSMPIVGLLNSADSCNDVTGCEPRQAVMIADSATVRGRELNTHCSPPHHQSISDPNISPSISKSSKNTTFSRVPDLELHEKRDKGNIVRFPNVWTVYVDVVSEV